MKTKYIVALLAVVFSSGVLVGFQLESSEMVEAYEPLVKSSVPADVSESSLPAAAQSSPVPGSLVATTNETERELQQRIVELEQQLTNRDKELAVMHQGMLKAVALSSGDNSTSTLTLPDAQALLPEPFAGLLAKQKGLVVDYLYAHQSESVDTEWAYELEQKVRDHFASHENAAKLKLSSVSCKTSLCEIRGFEYQPNVFTEVSSSLSVQPWWRFGRSYTMHDGENNNGYFYLIAKKTP